jgi:Lon protease-like protein
VALRTLGADNRRHNRVAVGYRAGIRYLGRVTEAEVLNASRAGIRVSANCRLRVNGVVEIAVPYCKDSDNLWLPARVSWMRESAIGDHEYGLQHYRRKENLEP